MRRTGLLLVFLSCIAFLIPACDEKIMTGSVDCSECYQEKPDSFRLNVYLTFNDSIDEIPLVLFNGNYEDKDIDYIDTAWAENGNPYWVYVKVDKEYSVVAEYRFSGKSIYAVDGTRLKAKHVSEDVCYPDCWVIVDNTLELELKNEFLTSEK
ncbi:MAG: hypothetical protein JXR41_15570 [Bacteroidales bacterium]|nr:hypothetical protein [Bacteroidales bacterium]MBN2764513.1 hypothetical protein [Bacteroidales bacterium]